MADYGRLYGMDYIKGQMFKEEKMSRFNLKGWKFSEWLKGNGKTIKEIAKVGIPLMVAWWITKNPTITVIATAFGKLVLDTLEFYIKE